MLDQALQSLKEALSIGGVRRVLWFAMIVTVAAILFEVQTNYFELNGIAKRLEIVTKAAEQPVSLEQSARLEQLKDRIVAELELVEYERTNRLEEVWKLLVRFVKGSWITLPLFWIVIKLAFVCLQGMKNEELQARGLMVFFGWLGLSVVTWITTLLGLNSVIWNTSSSFLISWVVFPACSTAGLLLVVLWIMLLRALLPSQKKAVVAQGDTASGTSE